MYEQREACGALTSILLAYEEKAYGAYMTTHAQQKGEGWMVSHRLQAVCMVVVDGEAWLAICVCGPDSFVEENPKKERKHTTPHQNKSQHFTPN